MSEGGRRPGKIKIYDTTLRDGTQSEDIAFSVDDKLRIAVRLDELLNVRIAVIRGRLELPAVYLLAECCEHGEIGPVGVPDKERHIVGHEVRDEAHGEDGEEDPERDDSPPIAGEPYPAFLGDAAFQDFHGYVRLVSKSMRGSTRV